VPIELGKTGQVDRLSSESDATLAALRDRIAVSQVAQVARGGRAIIVLEGLEGSLKTAVIRQLAAALDPRFFKTLTVTPDRRRSSAGHWLARFWTDLPAQGCTALYFNSWYRRVLEERVLGLAEQSEWTRAYDEINEFEAQQRDYGTLIVKLFFHVTEGVRARRLAERAEDERAIVTDSAAEFRTSALRPAYDDALTQMLSQNNLRWSPWTVIDADQSGPATISALTAVADALSKAFPKELAIPGSAPSRHARRSGRTTPA
jgi:polyphosphate kinase 2 (PPK2 family)